MLILVLSVSLAVLQATELLREITAVDPADYEQQQHADAAGVRSVAAFIADLSDRYRQNCRRTRCRGFCIAFVVCCQ